MSKILRELNFETDFSFIKNRHKPVVSDRNWIDIVNCTVPKSCKRIGNYAFYNCDKLKSIVLPKKLSSIGVGAFEGCTSLTKINLDKVKTIGNNAFYSSGLSKLTLPKSLTYIGEHSFEKCTNLTKLRIKAPKLNTISKDAFAYCVNLPEIIIPKTVKHLGEFAFMGCDEVGKYVIHKNLTYDRGAFGGIQEKFFDIIVK